MAAIFSGAMQPFALTGLAGKNRGIEIASERIEDHTVCHTVLRIALLHERIHEQLAIGVGEEFVDLRFAGSVFRCSLVVRHGDPLADGKV